ncbi:hypothetical protein HYT84_03535 [Candidatus Micrarchaeota archaeon]|nr:hypothetical protein [Candidatus Micrarchaeota archaeon]
MSYFARLEMPRDFRAPPQNKPPVLSRREPAFEFIRRLYGERALMRDSSFHPYIESGWLPSGISVTEETDGFRRFLRRAKLFLEHNFLCEAYYLVDKTTVSIPRIVRLFHSGAYLESSLRHELTHHAQRGTEVSQKIYSLDIEERTAAWIALEGPAVYSEAIYFAETHSNVGLRDKFAYMVLNKLAKFAKTLLKRINRMLGDNTTFTAEGLVSIPFNELYTRGIQLAIYITENLRFSPKRMFEILCNHPPKSIAEATNPEIYIKRLREEGLVG